MKWKRSRTTERVATAPRRDVKVQYLAETDLFKGMSGRDLDDLERNTAMTTCTRGTVFFSPGETGEALFVLKKGRVNIYRMTPEGRKLVTATIEPGTVFGEMSLIGQGMLESFAEAAEDCTLCVMSRTDVERLLREHPSISIHLLEIVARRLADAETLLADVAYKPVPARIATALLRLSGPGPETRAVHLSHQDIADMVGTYRETATRILNELRAAGVISLERMLIEVVDRRRLEELAEEGG